VALNDTVNKPWSTAPSAWRATEGPVESRRSGEGKPEACSVSIAGVDVLKLMVHCPGHYHEAHASGSTRWS